MPFNCEVCGSTFGTIKKYETHCATKKHLRKIEEFTIYRCPCGKSYLQRSNLYRHKKSCTYVPDDLATVPMTSFPTTGQTIVTGNIVHSNTYVENEIKAEIQETNVINPTFNFNFYLNEQCKDAVCIEDFCRSVIDRIAGLANSNIQLNFIDNVNAFDQMIGRLKGMEAVQRPIQSYQGEIVEKSHDDWKALTLDKLNKHVNGITNKVNWDLYNLLRSADSSADLVAHMEALKKATEVKPPLKTKEMEALQKTTDVTNST